MAVITRTRIIRIHEHKIPNILIRAVLLFHKVFMLAISHYLHLDIY